MDQQLLTALERAVRRIARAEDAVYQVRSNVVQLQMLTDLHKAEVTEEQTRIDMLRKLCVTSKLDSESDECLEVMVLEVPE